MEDKMIPSIETGAMTLVLLVKNYRGQMIALLLKNGVAVPSGASNQQIAVIMANLLKVSKSFAKDISRFIQNPKVVEVLAGGLVENSEYFRASGFADENGDNAKYFRADGFMNYQGNKYGIPDFSFRPDDSENETSATPKKASSFWSGLNFADILNKGLETFGNIDKNKTDREIARAQTKIGGGKVVSEDEDSGSGSGSRKGTPDDEGMSTTTIVVLSLVGIAVVGTIIYFVARPKKQ
jgi:hypothetical protein